MKRDGSVCVCALAWHAFQASSKTLPPPFLVTSEKAAKMISCPTVLLISNRSFFCCSSGQNRCNCYIWLHLSLRWIGQNVWKSSMNYYSFVAQTMGREKIAFSLNSLGMETIFLARKVEWIMTFEGRRMEEKKARGMINNKFTFKFLFPCTFTQFGTKMRLTQERDDERGDDKLPFSNRFASHIGLIFPPHIYDVPHCRQGQEKVNHFIFSKRQSWWEEIGDSSQKFSNTKFFGVSLLLLLLS